MIFSSILAVFGKPIATQEQKDTLAAEANFWALMFVALAAATFLVNFFQISCFTASGERLTRRIRLACFTALLRQEVGYFDDPKNSPGVLITRLADDAGQIKGLTGQLLGTIVQTLASMIVGFFIAFYYSWQLTLIVLGAIPVMAVAGMLQLKVLQGFGAKTKKACKFN